MSSPETVRRLFRRTDVLAGFVMSSLLVLLVAAGGLGLYAWLAMENLEEADRWMKSSLELVAGAFAPGSSPAAREEVVDLLREKSAMGRIRSGEFVRSWGKRIPDSQVVEARDESDSRNLGALWLLRQERYLVGHTPLPGDGSAELGMSLRYYASVDEEFRSAILLNTAMVGLGAVLLCIFSIRVAFAPLRRATALVREVDARSLGSRLPTRSTADPIDLHAEALNQVLEKIDASFSRLRAFSANAAHELRTPINRVRNVVEVALRGGEERELRSALETVETTTSELCGMVDSLLLLAEIDERRLEPHLSEFDPGEWVRGVVDFYTPLFEEKGTTLTSHVDACSLTGDRTLLDRVLVNLLENALQHTGAGDDVEIRADGSGPRFRLSLDDSGPGIDADDRQRIFDRFVRIHPNGRRGSGLGLALARAIARLHGGDLVATPSPLGGTRLELRLWTDAEAPAELAGVGAPDSRGALPEASRSRA